MSSLTIELPESLREFVERQATERGLGTAGDYLVALAGEARRKAAQERLKELLLEGEESGPAIPATPEFWTQFLSEYDARHGSADGR